MSIPCGGATQTLALLAGSPAIDAGDNADAPDFDQRGDGFPRIVNNVIDIGAFEVQNAGGGPGRSAPKPFLVTAGAVLPPALLPTRPVPAAPIAQSALAHATLCRPEIAAADWLFAPLAKGDAWLTLSQPLPHHRAEAESWALEAVPGEYVNCRLGEFVELKEDDGYQGGDLVIATLGAVYPARRAARVNPIRAVRHE
jgi:hypothetical protein